jgi:hypothetical protein
MEEDANVILELTCLVFNNKKEVCEFWIILFLSKEVWKKKPIICYPWCWTLGLWVFV